MTSPIDTNNVVERLRRTKTRRAGAICNTIDTPVNPDGPEAADLIQSLSDRIDVLEGENGRLRRCLLPVHMMLAQAECVDDPIPDDTVVLHFMGSGASDQVTAGEVRASLETGNAKR